MSITASVIDASLRGARRLQAETAGVVGAPSLFEVMGFIIFIIFILFVAGAVYLSYLHNHKVTLKELYELEER